MFNLGCLVFQGLVYAFHIHQDIAEEWFYFWFQRWIECSNRSKGFVRTTVTFARLWNYGHTVLAKYMSAICNVKFDVSFGCIAEQHSATITMNPKRIHFRVSASQILSQVFSESVGFSSDLVFDVSSFTKKIRNEYEMLGASWLSDEIQKFKM